MLLLSGEEDHAVPEADRYAVASALTAAGFRHEIVAYPGTSHGFMCDRRDTYAPAAAKDAWEQVARLLRHEFGV